MAGLDRDKALDMALANIEKQYGKGSVMRLGDEVRPAMKVIPTGSIALDVALGVGGLPRGRVIEIYGPESSGKTTVALHAVASAQAAGGIAAFIDAEHALDPDYAKALGVDTDALLVSQPDTGEQALEITDMLVRSGALDIVVIDSVAALVPRAEIEGEMGDSHVGLQARLMSQALRKLTGALSNSGTTLIFINQLREKIGVMFGCGSYHTKVTLADGSQESLGKIVNQKLPVEVLSYDVESGAIVPKKVVNWFNNGKTPEFLQFKVARAAGGIGRAYASLAMTRNHLIRTPGGWREAGEICVGDRVMLSQPHRLNPQQWQVILGGLMGDGSLSQPVKRDGSSARYRMGRGAKQVGYLDWKASLLGNIQQCRTTNAKGAAFVDLQPLAELAELRAAVYIAGQKVISWDYLKSLTPLALAIWYMDDGSFTVRSKGVQARTAGGSGRVAFCVEAMSEGSRDRLVSYLRDTHKLEVSWRRTGARGKAVLTFTTPASARFMEMVAPYVHPSMDYKLLPRLRGLCTVEPHFAEPIMRPVPAEVVGIRVRDDFQSMNRFDIEVEGSHNYLADGVIVHNSPETTTGGKALKFYASVRLDVRRIETLKDGTDAVGNRTRIKVVKNKCLAEGSLIFDPTTGITRRIEDIVDNRLPVSVVAAAKDNTLHVRPVTNWFDQGEQDVIGLRLQGGTDLWVTPDHQVLTDLGWQLAGSLDPGDRVARPRQFPGLGGWSQDGCLARDVIDPILGHLDRCGITPHDAAVIVGPLAGDPRRGMKQVLGASLLRRDRVQALADGLADEFLQGLLAEEVCYSAVREVLPVRRCRTFDVEVEELHTLVADGVVVHNCSPPFKQAEFDIIYGQGISREGSLIDVGVEQGFIRKAGAWYTYDGDQLGQGKENARSFLRDNPDLANEIEKKIKEKLGIGPVLDVDLPIDVAPVDF